jgi:cytoskeletal protein RodZ
MKGVRRVPAATAATAATSATPATAATSATSANAATVGRNTTASGGRNATVTPTATATATATAERAMAERTAVERTTAERMTADRTASAVEVVPLCDGEWRLCDRRIPADDSRRLLSYVSRDGDGFEVLWLPTLTVQRVASLEAAIEAARRACAEPPA